VTADREAAVRRLERYGLEATGEAAPDGPSVNATLYTVNGFEVEPVATSPADGLDKAWHHHTAQASLHAEKREFFILPPVPGGSRIGWVHVKDPVGRNLPSRIAEVTGPLEFVTVSVDGRNLCYLGRTSTGHVGLDDLSPLRDLTLSDLPPRTRD
jgi:hypothetical protein